MENIAIEDVSACLDDMGLQYMATVGLDGKPKVRPVQYMVLRDGKLWFCTNEKKSMYAELQKSPFIDLCASRLEADEMASRWIRFSAEAVFPDDDEKAERIKDAIIEKSPIVRELYKDKKDRRVFKVFYLKNLRGALNNLGHVKGLAERVEFEKPKEFSL